MWECRGSGAASWDTHRLELESALNALCHITLLLSSSHFHLASCCWDASFSAGNTAEVGLAKSCGWHRRVLKSLCSGMVSMKRDQSFSCSLPIAASYMRALRRHRRFTGFPSSCHKEMPARRYSQPQKPRDTCSAGPRYLQYLQPQLCTW